MKKISVLLLSSILIAVVAVSCRGKDEESTTSQKTNNIKNEESETTDQKVEEEIVDELSGTIVMEGSTSMEKLANSTAEAFMDKHLNVIVTTKFTGSSTGVEALINGDADIGNASRGLKDTEISEGAVENVMAIDGIALITDNANSVNDLTREEGSGTRGAFEELLDIEGLCQYEEEIDATSGVMAKVASTPGTIDYVSIDILNESIQAINLNGVEPTSDNIKSGYYSLSRLFVMATMGEISYQDELNQ